LDWLTLSVVFFASQRTRTIEHSCTDVHAMT
jgi:hypothetical protein